MNKICEERRKERLEYAKEHTLQEFAEHFDLTIATARQFYHYNRLSAKTGFEKHKNTLFDRISESTWKEYSKDHVIMECMEHFDIKRDEVYRLESKYKTYALRHNKRSSEEVVKNKIKRTGEMQDMIRYLSNNFTYSAISRVFGYTKERVRQICKEGEC